MQSLISFILIFSIVFIPALLNAFSLYPTNNVCTVTQLHNLFHSDRGGSYQSKKHCKPIWCFVELHRDPHVQVKDVLEVQVLLKIMMVLQNTGEPSIFNLEANIPTSANYKRDQYTKHKCLLWLAMFKDTIQQCFREYL